MGEGHSSIIDTGSSAGKASGSQPKKGNGSQACQAQPKKGNAQAQQKKAGKVPKKKREDSDSDIEDVPFSPKLKRPTNLKPK